MTSSVKIVAHPGDGAVQVIKSGGGNHSSVEYLKDGEETEITFYDDITITVKEVIHSPE